MSGIVGLVQFNGAPVEPEVLRKLTDTLVFRGPDAQQTWIKDNVGFAHTLFKTTEESVCDSQPLTLDGKNWIVADARIDAREELFAALKTAGGTDISRSDWTDAEMILRSYRLWGASCVDHLLGDFSFGIWDDTRQQLFCARDHMGVKPFYYAQLGSSVIFSNTLDCIRRHPSHSDRLNDLAVADFLLFEFNQDLATTAFAEIQRLPPAHCGIWSRDRFCARRYWSMPVDDPIFYKQPDDYTDQFHHLLRKCVADRLRTKQVWVFMSGGLDSPTLAATAQRALDQCDSAYDLRAITSVDDLVPEEREYAEGVAAHLGIPIHYRRWTEFVDPLWENISFATPEPCPNAWLIPAEDRFWRGLGRYSRVFFFGEGPDNALRLDWRPYVSYLVRRRHYGWLLRGVFATLFSERRPPWWGTISRKLSTAGWTKDPLGGAFPAWFNPDFESRLDLRERWRRYTDAPRSMHPIRPRAYASLQTPLWQTLFEGFDSGSTKMPCEVRYPFVDLRMLRFLLAVPPLPWCRSKYLLRRAMRGLLPPAVLRRAKTGLPRDLLLKNHLWRLSSAAFTPSEHLSRYVDLKRLLGIVDGKPELFGDNLTVRSFNHWLKNSLTIHSRQQKSVLREASRSQPAS
jgi:asparagine synthase (glutamine-hydrolysing)